MHEQQSRSRPDSRPSPPDSPATLRVDDQSLVLRNYDADETHSISITFVDPDDNIAFDRSITVDPLATVSIETRLERAVYRVTVRTEEESTASADCLVGSGPDECAVVETGNGTVTVSDGLF